MLKILRLSRFIFVIVLFNIHPVSSAGQDLNKINEYFSSERYDMAVKEIKKYFTANHLQSHEYAQYCILTGIAYERLAVIDSAEIFYLTGIKTYRSIPVENFDLTFLTAINNLASIYQDQGKYDLTLPLAEESLLVAEKLLGKDHPTYGTILNNLSSLYIDMGQYQKAQIYSIEAVENTKLNYGKEHAVYGNRINNLAVIYKKLGQFIQALPLFTEALLIEELTGGKNSAEYALRLNNLAMVYSSIARTDTALILYNEALDITEKTLGKSNPEYCTRLNNVAMLYKETGNYDKALPLFLEVIEISENVQGKNHPDYATYINNLASLYSDMANYNEALPLYIESMKIRENALGKDHPSYGTSVNNLGSIYNNLGQYDKALTYYLEAYNITLRSLGKDHPDYGIRANNLAGVYHSVGQYEKSIDYYKKAIQNAESNFGKENPEYASRISNLALLYIDLGQYDKALVLLKETIEIREGTIGKDHPDYGASLNNLGQLYQKMWKPELSEPLFMESLSITEASKGKLHPDYYTIQNNLAMLYSDMRQYDKAIRLLLEVVENTEKTLGKDHPDYGSRLNSIAVLYFFTADYESAISSIKAALKNVESNYGAGHPNRAIMLNNMAMIYEFMGRPDSAYYMFIESIDITNNIIDSTFAFMSENEKECFLLKVKAVFSGFNSFTLKYRDIIPDAQIYSYNNALANKGVLLKQSKSMHFAINNSHDSILINKFNDWIDLKKQIALQSSKRISDRNINVRHLEDSANLMEQELVAGSKDLLKIRSQNRIGWKSIRDSLNEDESAIEFVSFDYSDRTWTDSIMYCALVVTPEREYPIMIPLFEEKELSELIDSFKTGNETVNVNSLYKKKRGARVATSLNGKINYSNALYSLIWKPMDSILSDIRKVYYSPSGLLNYISFSALPFNDSLYLSDKYELEFVSSTSRIVDGHDSKLRSDNSKIAIFGGLQYEILSGETVNDTVMEQKSNPEDSISFSGDHTLDTKRGGVWNYLEGTLYESENIENIVSDNNIQTSLYLGEEGNEESFKSLSGEGSPQLIHIATHGFFFPDHKENLVDILLTELGAKTTFQTSNNPLFRSGLILAGGNEKWNGNVIPEGIEDGILTAYEVSGINLFNTKLVVLSACETGLGDIKGSEGVYGLQRSFKMAGVDYLIMSLWQVPDKETSEFMIMFYSKLMETKDIRVAFAEAQKEMRNKYDPYYWAAFVLIQ